MITADMIHGYCGSYYDILHPGDEVEGKFVDELIDMLPPATLTGYLVQVGEPYDTAYDKRAGKWRNTYATFTKRTDASYTYRGHCFRGKMYEPKKEKSDHE